MPGMTDRDHFAAAALTGFASQPRFNCGSVLTLTAKQCYELADAMLRERERKNHDAAPAARAAPSESSAPLGKGLGTGDTQEPVAWAVVHPNDEVGVIAFNRCRAEAYATASDRVVPLYRQPPVTKPDPDSRVWETHTPATHATQGEGSEQRECTEPVAWAVMLADGERIYDVYATAEEAKAIDEAVTGNHGVVPLYRSPTLTDAEREALEWASKKMRLLGDAYDPERAATLRGLLERLGGGR